MLRLAGRKRNDTQVPVVCSSLRKMPSALLQMEFLLGILFPQTPATDSHTKNKIGRKCSECVGTADGNTDLKIWDCLLKIPLQQKQLFTSSFFGVDCHIDPSVTTNAQSDIWDTRQHKNTPQSAGKAVRNSASVWLKHINTHKMSHTVEPFSFHNKAL